MVSQTESTFLESTRDDSRIRLEDLHIAFGPNQVLRGVNLRVRKAETLVVVGRSGEGKSVLLKHIIALLKPDRGEVWVDDYRMDTLESSLLKRVRKKVAMIFQGSALFDSMTVEENVAFPYTEEKRLPKKEIHERVVENLRRVHLTDPSVLEKKPAELSGGMKKRVGVARALSMEPEIVLWDEPTTGLDPVTADAINDLMMETREHTRATSVVVTHDMASAFKVGDRMALLHRGRIVYEDTIEATRETNHGLMRQFIDGTATGPLTEEEGEDLG